jgi:hypothetical protein
VGLDLNPRWPSRGLAWLVLTWLLAVAGPAWLVLVLVPVSILVLVLVLVLAWLGPVLVWLGLVLVWLVPTWPVLMGIVPALPRLARRVAA